MYDTTHISLSKSAEKLFDFFLFFYPEEYRKKYGQEMYLLFVDMYQEELTKHGSVGTAFWFTQFADAIQGIIQQHMALIGKIGMKKYVQQTMHLNKYNLIGGIFLLPLLTMFGIDVVSRILQRDLVHYSRPVYHFLSQTPFYWYPVLFTWAILLPLFAVLINLFPLIQSLREKKTRVFSRDFVKRNLGSLIILAIGLGFLALLKLHDFAPCTIHGILRLGVGQLFHILSFCRNA